MDRKNNQDTDFENKNQVKSNHVFDIPPSFNIEKHLNSRLFKRFLEEENKFQKSKAKVTKKADNNEKARRDLTPQPQVKPETPPKEKKTVQYYQQSPETPKSTQYHSLDEIKGFSQHIPAYMPQVDISRQNSFANFAQFQYPMQNYAPNYYSNVYPQMQYPQMQFPDMMMLRQQTESLQGQLQYYQQIELKHKEELDREKREFQELLAIKDNEIIKIKKNLENARFDIMDLEDQLRNCNSDDFNNLQKRCLHLEEQLSKANNKNDRDRYEDSETEMRSYKAKIEDLQRELVKSREKFQDLENKNKNANVTEKELMKAHVRIEDLEIEIENYKKKYNKEIKQLSLENEQLKQQINHKKNRDEAEDRYYEPEAPSRLERGNTNQKDSHSPMIRNMSRTNNSSCVESALNWETPPRSFNKKDPKRLDTSPIPSGRPDIDPLSNMESKLNMLQSDKQRLENEYMRIPNTSQNRRRKEDIELEIDILNTNISNLKNKIRNLR